MEKANPDWVALKNVIDNQMGGHVAALEALENAEIPVIRKAIFYAVEAVKTERRAAAQKAGQKTYGAKALDETAIKYLADVRKRLTEKIGKESANLKKRIETAKGIEGRVSEFFTKAIDAIKLGQPLV